MAKKRANGEGNIRKRKDGRWEGRYTAGYDSETGKRIIKNVLGKTQAEVKEKDIDYFPNPSIMSTISMPMRCWASLVAAPMWGVQETLGWL